MCSSSIQADICSASRHRHSLPKQPAPGAHNAPGTQTRYPNASHFLHKVPGNQPRGHMILHSFPLRGTTSPRQFPHKKQRDRKAERQPKHGYLAAQMAHPRSNNARRDQQTPRGDVILTVACERCHARKDTICAQQCAAIAGREFLWLDERFAASSFVGMRPPSARW